MECTLEFPALFRLYSALLKIYILSTVIIMFFISFVPFFFVRVNFRYVQSMYMYQLTATTYFLKIVLNLYQWVIPFIIRTPLWMSSGQNFTFRIWTSDMYPIGTDSKYLNPRNLDLFCKNLSIYYLHHM